MTATKITALAFYLLVFQFLSCIAQTNKDAPLKLIATIPLPHVRGRMDHLDFDSKRQLVFVAAKESNTIEIVDLKNTKVIHTIKNLSEPQGIVYIPMSNSILVAYGGNGECDVFDATSFQKNASIKLSGDADNVRYDSTDKKIYVGYGEGGIAVIDAVTFKLLADIKLSGHPESFQIDRTAGEIYVNVPDEQQIEIIDLEKLSVTGKWKMTEAKSNFPMALDEPNHRLFIGCRNPAKLLVIDTQTGKTISSLPIDKDTDDIFYNKDGKQIYVSCGEGFLDVIKQTDVNIYTESGRMTTHSDARTSLFIPESSQLIVASPSGSKGVASLLVYSTK